MNAIILAAGEGKRLRPLTNDKPKCLVELFGKTLLEWQLSIFKKCGINDICIVTGHNSQMFRYTNVDYIKNENFDLIFSGLQSNDQGFAQVGLLISEYLNTSHASLVMGTEMINNNTIKMSKRL
mgnify:CR=1 FL=1